MPLAPSDSGVTSRKTVVELFQQVVFERPDAIAIIFEDRELTFRQLDELANQFAEALEGEGVKPGDCVGLCVDRCPEAIAGMFGVLKVGAVFVPLDPEYPLERIQFMIRDAGIKVILTHDKQSLTLASELDAADKLIWIDSCTLAFAGLKGQTLLRPPMLSDLAYVMYTSGSTGKPKGVQIEHLALTTYCMADIEAYQLTCEDRTLQFSTLNFDIAIEEIFPPLLIGGSVVIRPKQRASDSNELSTIIFDYQVTAVHLATAYWHEWVDLMLAKQEQVPSTLRLVIATGEKVSVQHYRRWQALCNHDMLWCNAYGPTETTVTATVFVPDASFEADAMPIGKGLPEYTTYILDEQHKPITNTTDTGELYIGGPALARGYLNRPELTAAAFIEVNLPDVGETRLYRTGDLARWLADGNIEFAGRRDHQIKLGSYRIEPGEIETCIQEFPSVREALVLYQEVDSQKYLIAYLAASSDLSLAALHKFLIKRMPAYMVPARFSILESLPKTINGKVDRDALPRPVEAQAVLSDVYIAPRNAMEIKLAKIWCRVLNLPRVGVTDDFFALGGSSLLVTKVVTELHQEMEVDLPVRDFFANPTIESSACQIRRLLGEDVAPDEEVLTQRRAELPELNAGYVGVSERRLFYVHYRPPVHLRRHSPKAVLICQPIGHEYARAHRNLQQLGVMLATAGYDVLRFDYFGTGNSSGDCQQMRVESLQADTRKMYHFLRDLAATDRVSVLGLRLGATIAATSGLDPQPDRWVLWDPVTDGQHFVQTLSTFQEYALTSQTRYSHTLSGEGLEDQFYGHAWDDDKRLGIARLRLPMEAPERNLLISSREYVDSEPGLAIYRGWNQQLADDDIFWHRPDFTELAFASAHANRMIVDFLCQDD